MAILICGQQGRFVWQSKKNFLVDGLLQQGYGVDLYISLAKNGRDSVHLKVEGKVQHSFENISEDIIKHQLRQVGKNHQKCFRRDHSDSCKQVKHDSKSVGRLRSDR